MIFLASVITKGSSGKWVSSANFCANSEQEVVQLATNWRRANAGYNGHKVVVSTEVKTVEQPVDYKLLPFSEE